MDLMHNEVIRVAAGDLQGTYRVVLDEPAIQKVVVVRLDRAAGTVRRKVGRRRKEVTKTPRKKAPAPLVGDLLWFDRSELEALDANHHLIKAQIEPDPIFFNPVLSQRDQRTLETRKAAMEEFLSLHRLRDGILVHSGLGGLVASACERASVSRGLVYKLWSLLCHHGITETSLRPMRERCGAPGVARPCDPGGRRKPGRKTLAQVIATRTGQSEPPVQPGMCSDWRERILAADSAIPEPKPPMPTRCTLILNSHFVDRFKYVGDKLVAIDPAEAARIHGRRGKRREVAEFDPPQRTYPNRRQIRRVLEQALPRLVRFAQKTTEGHYARNHRGLVARNWMGVPGPGHTWAIDSTIGDIYLRSSVNPAWIIGRPVVYIVCDVWSTAIVGFYVCLRGPSWDMAKLAIFGAAAGQALMGELWGYQPVVALSPAPTLPAIIWCDRGEYLSKGARLTGSELILAISYTPPYRPDLKGIVEVLHRIMKDTQYAHFIPGAIDARRAELELRRFNPDDGTFTVRQFVHYLQVIFTEYNLKADRSQRLDAHMIGAGVFPSPAGLWAWGHRVGVGTRRAVAQSDLVASLLLAEKARVSRNGVIFAGRHYESEVVRQQQWTAQVRISNGWDIPVRHYAGSVSRIWTPNTGGHGFLDLTLSDQSTASPELTYDEVLDAFAYERLQRADREHERTMIALKSLRGVEDLVHRARTEREEAIARYKGPMPTLTEARSMENMPLPERSAPSQSPEPATFFDEAEQAHLEMMKAISAAANEEAEQHE